MGNFNMGNQPSRQPGNTLDFSSMMSGGNPFASFGQPAAPAAAPASTGFDMSSLFGGANNLFASFGGGAPPAPISAQKEVKELVT